MKPSSNVKNILQQADGSYIYRIKDALDENDLGRALYVAESSIMELMKSLEPDYSHLREHIPDFDLRSVQANPHRIKYVSNPTVKLCLIAIDLLPDKEFYLSPLVALNDSPFLKNLKIVNADSLEDAVIELCNKQRIIDTLSGRPELLNILKSFSRNLEFLNTCDSEESAFNRTSNFFDLMNNLNQNRVQKI